MQFISNIYLTHDTYSRLEDTLLSLALTVMEAAGLTTCICWTTRASPFPDIPGALPDTWVWTTSLTDAGLSGSMCWSDKGLFFHLGIGAPLSSTEARGSDFVYGTTWSLRTSILLQTHGQMITQLFLQCCRPRRSSRKPSCSGAARRSLRTQQGPRLTSFPLSEN